MPFTRLIKRVGAYRRYRSRYLATIEQLSNLSNQQLQDLGIDRWEIADHARASALRSGSASAR